MILSRRTLTLALPLVLLASCTKEPDPEPTPTLETPENTNPLPPSDGGEDADGVEATAPADPSSEDTTAVIRSAEATMEAFWDTSKPQEEWYKALSATMTPAGGEPFEYTLVENVAPGKLTGDASVTWRTPDAAVVTLPTNLGEFTLLVIRTGDGWLTESITFPKEG